jgi:CheY-like chemotaxis protein
MRIVRGLPGADRLLVGETIAADVPRRLNGDAPRIAQVLINLLGNAVKFTAAGSVTLDVRRDQDRDDGPALSFAVSDTGCGIDLEDQRRIFDPFEQARASGTAPRKGTGLGLAICRRIADLLGGGLTLSSRAGAGSTFVFTLPLVPAIAAPPQDLTADAVADAPRRPLRILVAEDTPSSQMVMRLILERLGHEVRIVEDGVQAVEAFATGIFDIVFLDIQMPRMDGLEAARRIAALIPPDAARAVPIVGLSALTQDTDREQARAYGMSSYVAKPVRYADIARLIDRLRPGERASSIHTR